MVNTYVFTILGKIIRIVAVKEIYNTTIVILPTLPTHSEIWRSIQWYSIYSTERGLTFLSINRICWWNQWIKKRPYTTRDQNIPLFIHTLLKCFYVNIHGLLATFQSHIPPCFLFCMYSSVFAEYWSTFCGWACV